MPQVSEVAYCGLFCWDCGDYADCKTLAWLNPVHAGGNLKNIESIRNLGMALFLKGPKCW